MKVALIRFKKDGARRDFHMKSKRLVIGRAESATMRVPNTDVSREHCEIRILSDSVIVKDLGSSNGTFVNDERVKGSKPLKAGDRLSVGSLVLTAQIDGEPANVEPPLLESPAVVGASGDDGAGGESDAGLSDLIAQIGGEDDSSAFDLDLGESGS